MCPKSKALIEVQSFLSYLNAWEREVNLGFISKATAEGLRVTLTSTISILDYVTGKLGYKYLLPSLMSQDPLENTFGILMFATTIQLQHNPYFPPFCSLAKAPGDRNVSPTVIKNLLDKKENPKEAQSKLHQLVNLH